VRYTTMNLLRGRYFTTAIAVLLILHGSALAQPTLDQLRTKLENQVQQCFAKFNTPHDSSF
jgi:hypothetical protein